MKILNFGSLNYDYTYSVDHIVAPGETQSTHEMNTYCGGKGLNQSIAIARAGAEVYHAGQVGEDGAELIKLMADSGVKTDYVKTIAGRSGHTIIQVDKNAENCILLFGGANMAQTREYVDEVLSHFEEGDIILLQNEINELDYIIDQAYAKGLKVVLNPSPFNERLDSCDMKKIAVFLMNEVEGWQLTGKKEPSEILEASREKFPDAEIVLTLGSQGSKYMADGKVYDQCCYNDGKVDTTAAGDTFTGYFLAGMIEGLSVEERMKLAAKAASIACSRAGAAPSIPTRDEVLI